jgi:hypothetical protein
MLADQVDELVQGVFGGDALLDHLTAFVEGDLAFANTHIPIVGIGHFTRPVDDAAHDADLDAFEVLGAAADHGGGLLQVEERAATAGATDVLRLGDAHAGGLQYAECGAVEQFVAAAVHGCDEDAIAQTINEQSAHVGCTEELQALFAEAFIIAADDDGDIAVMLHQSEEQPALLGHAMRMPCVDEEHCRGVGLQLGDERIGEVGQGAIDQVEVGMQVAFLQILLGLKMRVSAGAMAFVSPRLEVVEDAKGAGNLKIGNAVAQIDEVAGLIGKVPFIQRNRVMIAECEERSRRDILPRTEVGHHAGHIAATYVQHFAGLSAAVFEGIYWDVVNGRDGPFAFAINLVAFYQGLRHRNLKFGVFG